VVAHANLTHGAVGIGAARGDGHAGVETGGVGVHHVAVLARCTVLVGGAREETSCDTLFAHAGFADVTVRVAGALGFGQGCS